MVQKIIDIVGSSRESFAKAADDAVKVAGKTVRNMKWARAHEFEAKIEGNNIVEFRVLMRIYFDVES